MAMKIAINGYGRIGRNILRAIYEAELNHQIQIVAINDLADATANIHLTKYDSTHGRFNAAVYEENGDLIVNNDRIKLFSERSPELLPWRDLGIDIVFECTGLFASKEQASTHLSAGAKKVLISAPAGTDVDKTIVFGINHQMLSANDLIVSNASCTTNCLAPLVKPLHDSFDVASGLMTTIHAYTNDQVLCDVYHSDLRRARSATASMIPTKTGAAAAVGLVLPELNGKLDGFAMRVPTMNVSVVDLSVIITKQATVEAVNNALMQAANDYLPGIVKVNQQPLVSIDFNHDAASAIFDIAQTKVIGNLVKVLAWYDNEWGFSNRMLDTARAMYNAG